jgi:hypothetical protein
MSTLTTDFIIVRDAFRAPDEEAVLLSLPQEDDQEDEVCGPHMYFTPTAYDPPAAGEPHLFYGYTDTDGADRRTHVLAFTGKRDALHFNQIDED